MADRNTKIRASQLRDGTLKPADLDATNSPTDNYLPSYDNATGKFTWAESGGASSFGITIDGSGQELETGYKGFIRIPYNCTITKATLLTDQSGSIVIDLWKCSYANYDGGSTHPVNGDSITASAPPTISSSTKSEDSTLTSWTKSITAGDIIGFNVDSITTVTKVTLIVEVSR